MLSWLLGRYMREAAEMIDQQVEGLDSRVAMRAGQQEHGPVGQSFLQLVVDFGC